MNAIVELLRKYPELALFATLYHVELAGKRLDAHVRELRELLSS